MSLINPGFEEGNVGWSIGPAGGIIRDGAKAYQGEWLSEQGPGALWGWGQVIPGGGATNITVPVYPGQVINASAWIWASGGQETAGVGGVVRVAWDNGLNSDGNPVVSLGAPTGWRKSSVRAVAPAGATTATFQVPTHSFTLNGVVRVDSATWDYRDNRSAVLVSPSNGDAFGVGDTIPLAVNITSDGAAVTSVQYFRNGTSLGTTTTAPYGMSYTTTSTGTETFYAVVRFANNQTITTPSVTVEVGVVYPEFRASNAYTYLIGENISSLASALPLSATIEGIEVKVDYNLHVLGRVKDKNVASPEAATSLVLFDIIDGANLEAILMSKSNNSYSLLGNPITTEIPVEINDFTLAQDGVATGSRWVVYEGLSKEAMLGGEEERFGLESIAAADFADMAMGFRFIPNLAQVPGYADSGEAAYRVFLDRVRVSIYFDAGSVEYYFASPDKTQVIKGTLASANVFDGSFRSADASGLLQLTSELEIMEGDQEWIGNDWTIHAAYPPTDSNKIGNVAEIDGEEEVGMEYNGLPTQADVKGNRSRYQMITANFYGDKDLNSIYGTNGVDRAFAHNGEWFYKIYTQPSAEKDKPRHVAYHHWHLALGYEEGRVDISVVGEPYNFDGVLGASSWTIGDQVVGLLPLSGTILGVFGAKSVWGIAGTTVDNFSTQVISPNIGATEYTICDMGFPVYANAYGIYTLSQTQQYGDYLGVPMSQDISPWLRPRLVRKYTTDREVEVAWPVRHKNQYRLAFSDGYVVSMTMNGQSVPTFSKQKYFLTDVCVPGWKTVGEYTTSEGPSGGGWSVNFDKPKQVRISALHYQVLNRAGYPNGFIIETTNGTHDIENEANDWYSEFSPMPLVYDNVTAIYYSGAEDNSDGTAENTTYLVEAYEECETSGEAVSMYEQKAIVPAAVSSQLDVTGEERIHIAPYEDEVAEPTPPDPDPPAGECSEIYGRASETDMIVGSPAWLDESLPEASVNYLLITDAPSLEEFVIDQGNTYWYILAEIAREGPDFYLTRMEDWRAPWDDYGDPNNTLEVRGYLLESPEDFSVGVLAEGCVHIELAPGEA